MLTATVLLTLVGFGFFAAFAVRNYMKGHPWLGPMLFALGLLVALSRRMYLGAFDVIPPTRAMPILLIAIILVFFGLGVMMYEWRKGRP
jgi:hypothetical protein